MKPLNRVERNGAFGTFVLFFVLVIGLVATVLFFSIKVPMKQNEQLRSILATRQSERAVADSFNIAMKEALYLLDQFTLDSQHPEPTLAIKREVQFRIEKMNSWIRKIPGGDTSIYAKVVKTMEDLNNAKASIRVLKENGTLIQN